MEFFIKQNSTLPIIRLSITESGRSDFNQIIENIDIYDIKFSLKNKKNNRYVILNGDAYYEDGCLCFQLKEHNTKYVGIYEGYFTIKHHSIPYILPYKKNLTINIIESFTNKKICCK